MNILFVTFKELSMGSGAIRSISVLRALADAGHQIDVVAAATCVASHPNISILTGTTERHLSRRQLRRAYFKAVRQKSYALIHVVDEAALYLAHAMKWRKAKVVYEASRCFSGPNGIAPSWWWKLFPTYSERVEKKVLQRSHLVLTSCEMLTTDLMRIQEAAHIVKVEPISSHTLMPHTEIDRKKILSDFDGTADGIVMCCILQENRNELRKLLLAARKVIDVMPGVVFFFRGMVCDEAESLARSLDIRGRCRFLDRDEVEEYHRVLQISDAVLFIPVPGSRYIDHEIFAALHSPSPLIAVCETAYSGMLAEQNCIPVVSTSESIAEGILRVFQEPLLALAIAVEGQQLVADHHSFSSFKHKIRMAYHDL